MSLEETDRASAANAVAPRVTLADIEANIKSRHFVSAAGAVSEINADLNLLTICVLVCQNGFVVIGKSAPASPENFNRQLGEKFAYEDAVRQLWPLMGYSLREKLHYLHEEERAFQDTINNQTKG